MILNIKCIRNIRWIKKACIISVDDLMIVFNNSGTDVNSKSHDLIQDDTNINEVCNVIVVYKDSQNKATNCFQYTILYFDAPS